LEGGKASSTESPSGRLEFKLSHIRLTGSAELWSECYSGMALFGWKLLNESSKKLQTRKHREWKVKFMINKITSAINHSATNCLAQSNVQIFCNYTRSI
jgi:hypothetical protein